MIEANRPDVVVLDDGIGVVAVSMVHEVAPQAKVVLVWPSAVVPIGGDARVEPAKILRDLGPAVEHVMAPVTALTETFVRPDWIDQVRKDPATLRNKLAGKQTKKRPSVTRLQRRSQRLHPRSQPAAAAQQETREDAIPAAVVLLPVGIGDADVEPVLDIGGGSSVARPVEGSIDERSEWNRRLGTLALSGAAAVSALVLALALGGGRVHVSLVRGDAFNIPLGVPGFGQGAVVGRGSFTSGVLGAGGYLPGAIDPADLVPIGSTVDPTTDGGLGGDLANPGGIDSEEPAPPGEDPEPTPEPTLEPIRNRPRNRPGNDGGGSGKEPDSGLPGSSAEHNPHGGPPGQMGVTPVHGPGLGIGFDAEHGSQGHGHKH